MNVKGSAYDVLTAQFSHTYLVIPDLVDVTIDLAGSTIYLDQPRPNGLQLFYCVAALSAQGGGVESNEVTLVVR